MPPLMDEFNPNWLTHCPNLEELVLPGEMEKIKRGILVSERLRNLYIGKNVSSIEPGAFQGSHLQEIIIDDENPYICTDGISIYTKNLDTMVATACPVENLEVMPGCKFIGNKCCHGLKQLISIEFPDSVIEIGSFAFSDTGINTFVAPPNLKRIDEKAFFNCHDLREVKLNDGLEFIGESAFQGSALESIEIPRTVKEIDKSVTKGTKIIHSGHNCTFKVNVNSTDLFYDGEGGLYREGEDGLHLIQLIDNDKETYDVIDGAAAIDPYAFAYHDHISNVRIPSSVLSIGESAFRVCKNLRTVNLPEGLERIEDEAFFDTNLESLAIPSSLLKIGNRALVTEGAHFARSKPSIKSIAVSPDNQSFYVSDGMLCRRTDNGDDIILFSNSVSEVVFP